MSARQRGRKGLREGQKDNGQFIPIKQIPSDEGKNFPDLHIHIMTLKGWPRGIHHHCSKERLQGYLDGYHYRYNRRDSMDTIFHKLIKKMVNNKPIRIGESE